MSARRSGMWGGGLLGRELLYCPKEDRDEQSKTGLRPGQTEKATDLETGGGRGGRGLRLLLAGVSVRVLQVKDEPASGSEPLRSGGGQVVKWRSERGQTVRWRSNGGQVVVRCSGGGQMEVRWSDAGQLVVRWRSERGQVEVRWWSGGGHEHSRASLLGGRTNRGCIHVSWESGS